ncbi:MAG: THUMP domain-containing protein [Candidatus Atabeyarchaeum deiterrae]
MNFPIVLVRFSEIALKSNRTRLSLRRQLRQNILTRLDLDRLPFSRVEDTWDRLIIYTIESEKTASAVSRVFGVVSSSPAIECVAGIDEVSRIGCIIAGEKLKQGDTYAVRVRRVGEHEFSSHDIAKSVGSSVIEALNRSGTEVKVDLDSPKYELFIEMREERAFIYDSIVRGVGGLPLGSQGKVVLNLEDPGSIVAAWLMMKRGCTPVLVVFDSGEAAEELIALARSSLSPYASSELPAIQTSLIGIVRKEDSVFLRTSLEYLAMNDIALSEGAEGIVSSDHLEPSSSNKVEMLREYARTVGFPVFYPLVGFNLDYLIDLARRIGGEALALGVHSSASENKAEYTSDNI